MTGVRRPTTIGFLLVCLALVLAFEFSNGFHNTANAVATVIYTNSLKPLYAVVWSGLMNFLGVLLGGIAVAYALVQLIPPRCFLLRMAGRPSDAPAQGGSAELAAAAVIGVAGFTGFPVSTTHVMTGGISGTMVGSGCRSPTGDSVADRHRMGTHPSGRDHSFRWLVLSFVVSGSIFCRERFEKSAVPKDFPR